MARRSLLIAGALAGSAVIAIGANANAPVAQAAASCVVSFGVTQTTTVVTGV
jgi:hypothetical protein